MLRNDPDYLEIHRAADRIEPRISRAIVRAGHALASRVPMEELTIALEGDNPLQAARLVMARLDVADAYAPAGRIVSDTVIKGDKLAVDDINEELG